MRAVLVVAIVVAGGCGKAAGDRAPEPVPAAPAPPAVPPAAAGDPWAAPAAASKCPAQPFADELDLPEASAATWLVVDGKPALMVVADSGNRGAYRLVDPGDGSVRERGELPLGEGAGDDLEGLSIEGDRVWGLTSNGWLRAWKREPASAGKPARFALVVGPYPLGPVGGKDSLVCAPKGFNCGKNFEALCLRPGAAAGDCVGYAGAKADGRLYCMARDGDRLVADRARTLEVTPPLVLSSCDFSPDGRDLWVGTNMLGAARVYHVLDWQTPDKARAESVGSLGTGFPEGMAIGDDGAIYRFPDTGSAPSGQWKFRCK